MPMTNKERKIMLDLIKKNERLRDAVMFGIGALRAAGMLGGVDVDETIKEMEKAL